MNSIYIDSDHAIQVANMRTPFIKQSRFRPRNQKASIRFQQPDLNTLKNKAILTNLTNSVNGKLQTKATDKSDVNDICSVLIKTISSSVITHFPPKAKQKFDNIWKNDNNCYHQLNSVCKTGRPTENFEAQPCQNVVMKQLRTKIKRREVFLMNQFYQSEADKLNLDAIDKELKELLENVKNHKTLPSSQHKLHCIPEKSARHFESHFNNKTEKPEPKSLQTPLACIQEITGYPEDTFINEHPPSAQEIQETVSNLKSNKSSTGISVENIKTLVNSHATLKELENSFAKI